MSSLPASVTDLRYKCPICMESLFPPVFQCHNGHLMCEACQSRLENCAICRASRPEVDGVSTWVRSLEIERIIRVIQHPCPNEIDGCQDKLNFDQLEAHRVDCMYTKFPICRDILGIACEEQVRISDYEEHYERHTGNKFCNAPGSATLPYTGRFQLLDFPATSWARKRLYIENQATLFILIVAHDPTSALVKCKPYVLAGRAVANELNCKISILSGQNVKVMLDSPVFNIETKPEELRACVVLSHTYLETLFGPTHTKPVWRIELSKKN